MDKKSVIRSIIEFDFVINKDRCVYVKNVLRDMAWFYDWTLKDLASEINQGNIRRVESSEDGHFSEELEGE